MASAHLDSAQIRRAVADRRAGTGDPAWSEASADAAAAPSEDERLRQQLSEIIAEQYAALSVLALDPKIRQFLTANDPKALEQAEQARVKTTELFGEPTF